MLAGESLFFAKNALLAPSRIATLHWFRCFKLMEPLWHCLSADVHTGPVFAIYLCTLPHISKWLKTYNETRPNNRFGKCVRMCLMKRENHAQPP